MKPFFLILSSIALLSACHSIHNRSNEYLDAQNEAHLKTPEGLDSTHWKQSYPIPKGDTSGAQPVDMTPPGLAEDQAQAIAEQAEKKATDNKDKTAN